MKNTTLILNMVTMAIFGLVSGIALGPLHNRAIEYPSEEFSLQHLPPMSGFLVQNMWIAWAIPVIWAVLSLLMILGRKNTVEHAAIHTSATLLMGITMFFVFVMAGVFPFVGLIAHLK